MLGIFLIGSSLVAFVQVAPLFPVPITVALILAILLFIPLWKLWALVAIWRCARNSSSVGYKFLARAYVVLFVLTVIGAVLEKTYDEYREKSLPRVSQQP